MKKDGKAEAIAAIDKAVGEFWESHEAKQTECQHKNIFFGAGAFYLICNDCQQYWQAVKKMGSEDPDFAETIKELSGLPAKTL